jgi:alkyl sulfatase BDS1-like metallo-beta-lactamase superfamily hydrolase
VRNARARLVWSQAPYAFLDAAAPPPEVNPSLWRRARLNRAHGLFEVVPGVYQVRGLDLANMTLVQGERGVIVIDALTATEVTAAALALYRTHRGERPVTGVNYTHTHSDHWGGMPAVVDPADVLAGKVPLIAPEGFMHHAVAENVLAGPAMLRRSHYQFGPLLHKGPRGHTDN